ncbi:MAG: hypothetical protein L0H31_07850 [Nocardioidaceae bacterium]|nr:hypothetical protein [Nocardioidaceae bacterium]
MFPEKPSTTDPSARPDDIDTDLGILKTGKEADVFLLERADPHDPEQPVVIAAKRYRSADHRTFRALPR